MTRWDDECDFAVIGSGAGGATAAVVLSEADRDVVVLEEGDWVQRADFTEDVYGAMKKLFRSFGNQASSGSAVMPVLEGACVGGSTVMNGAIIHRFPESVWKSWSENDSGLAARFSFSDIAEASEQIERDLGVAQNLAKTLPSLPIHQTLERLGWEHSAMARNAPGCEASGRCLQGCPTGGKWSLEKTYIPRAASAGARVWSSSRVNRIVVEGDQVKGVVLTAGNGETKRLHARRGVVLSAGAIQSPLLLRRSGLGNSLTGENFQCHLGVAIAAEMTKPAKTLEGPPQGIEIHSFRGQGIKLATQLIPPELVLTRTPLRGEALRAAFSRLEYYTTWMGSIRSTATGTVRRGPLGGIQIRFSPSELDLVRTREALFQLATLLFEMGAIKVYPGIQGPDTLPLELNSPDEVRRIREIPLNPKFFWLSAGHLFGTCRMATDAKLGVVDNRFKVHGVENLTVLDASVFPTNLGVNPQHSVMALSMLGAKLQLS